MQILYENLRAGEVSVQIDCLDDLWVLYNILRPHDAIKGRTARRVVIKEGEAGERKPMVLRIQIQKVEFHEFTNRLRVLGTISEGPEDWVSVGDHHTFNLEPGDQIHIFKEQWYQNDIQRIRRNLAKKEATMILCVAIENGQASFATLSDYSVTPLTEISANIPGKRFKDQLHKEAVENFFENTAVVVEENISKFPVRFVLICGPGFTKEHFHTYLADFLQKKQKSIDLRVVAASTGEISGIYEILRNGIIASQKADFRLAQEEMLMADFIKHLGQDEGFIKYGLQEVAMAAEMGAIEHLLICDILLRTADRTLRNRIEEALNNTEHNRGTVHILNTTNPAGSQLERYGAIAAILRYRMKNYE